MTILNVNKDSHLDEKYNIMSNPNSLNKTEFLRAVAEDSEISPALAAKVFASMELIIAKTIKKGKAEVNITNFGTFKSTKYEGRTIPNETTGDIVIPPGYRVGFKPGKGLKKAVNGKKVEAETTEAPAKKKKKAEVVEAPAKKKKKAEVVEAPAKKKRR